MKSTDEKRVNDFFGDPGDEPKEEEKPDQKEPWDPDEDRKKDPAHEYMRSLLYDAKRWKESGHPEFEKRVLIVLKDFLHEHIQVL